MFTLESTCENSVNNNSRLSRKSKFYVPVDAPSAKDFTICPTDEMPPSAMTGTPNLRAYSATLYTAVPWGRPTAITVIENIIYCHIKTNISVQVHDLMLPFIYILIRFSNPQ